MGWAGEDFAALRSVLIIFKLLPPNKIFGAHPIISPVIFYRIKFYFNPFTVSFLLS